jgi:hypothetical protein
VPATIVVETTTTAVAATPVRSIDVHLCEQGETAPHALALYVREPVLHRPVLSRRESRVPRLAVPHSFYQSG